MSWEQQILSVGARPAAASGPGWGDFNIKIPGAQGDVAKAGALNWLILPGKWHPRTLPALGPPGLCWRTADVTFLSL